MHLTKYLAAKNTIAYILAGCGSGLVSGEQAASVILATIVPTMDKAIGMEDYFTCARGWLTQILLAEKKLTLPLLIERLQAIMEISPSMRLSLGGITGRLSLLSRI